MLLSGLKTKKNIELLTIGIGHDVTRYYDQAIKITDVQDLGDVMINQLTDLFVKKNKTTLHQLRAITPELSDISFILFINSLNGINIVSAINILTIKSPKAKETQGMPVAQKAIEKNKKVSIIDPKKEENKGAMNQVFFLKRSNICTSKF